MYARNAIKRNTFNITVQKAKQTKKGMVASEEDKMKKENENKIPSTKNVSKLVIRKNMTLCSRTVFT